MGTTSGKKGTTKAPAKIEPNNLLKLLGSTTTTTTTSGTKGTTKAPAKIAPNNLLKLLGSTTTTTTKSGTKGTTTVKQNSPVTGGGYIAPAPVPAAPVSPAQRVAAPVSPAQRVVYFYANYFLGNWNG